MDPFDVLDVGRMAMVQDPTDRGPVPPHWRIYFAVSDCEGQTTLAQSLGGAVRFPPTEAAGVGRYAVLADPLGADFAVIQLFPAAEGTNG